jgi:inner membrane protein
MASIGHIALGMAAARVDRRDAARDWRAMLLWSAVSLLPDADVIGFSLGVRYGDPWGHRGATHSLTLAVIAGLAIAVVARSRKRPFRRTALLAGCLLASHGLLDTMTDGGLGCALFWPFELTRYFAPWRPIPVAPIGLDFFTSYGAVIAVQELVLFLPAIVYSLRSGTDSGVSRSRGVLFALWVPAVWLMVSGDSVREAIVGLALREDTSYAAGFSEAAFRTVASGQSEENVRTRLGDPFGESWFYAPSARSTQRAEETSAASLSNDCVWLLFEAGIVRDTRNRDECRKHAIAEGLSAAEVRRLLGAPTQACWHYSRSPSDRRYRIRAVCFLNGRVETMISQWN